MSTLSLPCAADTGGRQQRSSSILEVTGWHPACILATNVKDRNDTGTSSALDCRNTLIYAQSSYLSHESRLINCWYA